MKHLRIYENFKDIDSICSKYKIKNYTINEDGSIDVNGNVEIYSDIEVLPLKFNIVKGNFICHFCELTTLENSPETVEGNFDCRNNKLTALDDGPKYVGGNYKCDQNQLVDLIGAPHSVGGMFTCFDNKLVTLEGCPKYIGGPDTEESIGFNCSRNRITDFDGCPENLKGLFMCDENPIYNIYKLFNDYGKLKSSLDYGYIRGNKIVQSRFQEALDELGIKMPKRIFDYGYI